MITKSFSTAWRNIMRDKVPATLNLAGLALGIACCIIIFFIVSYELSFDDFHEKKERIYRVTSTFRGDETNYLGAAPFPVGAAMAEDFAEVEEFTTVSFGNEGIIKVNEKLFAENGIAYVAPSFFTLFDYEWIVGTPEKALENPYSVVLTESVARKYFGDQALTGEAVIGKIIRLNDQTEFQVTGVMKDFPENTDFPFAILLSYTTLQAAGNVNLESWVDVSFSVHHYVLMREGADVNKMEAMMPTFLKKYLSKTEASQRLHQLQPLNQVHFDERFGNYNGRTPTRATILSLALVGLFLMLTACINFINLATAQSIKRSKEVGVRKVLGASRNQLVKQFMVETLLLTSMAMVIAILMTELFFPQIQQILDLSIKIDWFATPIIPLFIISLILVVTIMAGFYPALILSGYQPILALKNRITANTGNGLTLRRGLIIFQFVISQVLIISTLVVIQQLDYFNSQPLGFAKEAIIIVNVPQGEAARSQAFKNEISRLAGVQSVSMAMNIPGNQGGWFGAYNFPGSGSITAMPVEMKPVDRDYIKTFELSLLAGRDLLETDSLFGSVIINETLMRRMQIEDPQGAVGKNISVFGTEVPIIGVVKDFHSKPLREGLNPLLIFNSPNDARIAALKISTQNVAGLLEKIGDVFQTQYPESIFEYQFVDEIIASYYQEEQKLSQLFTIFSSIAIFIGCLGLYGLISFVAVQKTKEIGVRKVLGASVANIVFLFTREFLILILIAFLIAAPLAWYIMSNWLRNFEFRIPLGAQSFLVAIGFTLLIAAFTISFRSIRAALANPVKSLRSE